MRSVKILLPLYFALLVISSGEESSLLIRSKQGQQLLKWMYYATADNDNGSPGEGAVRAAQYRIAKMGPRADEMVIQMAVEAIDLQNPDDGLVHAGMPDEITATSLLKLALSDPNAGKQLVDPMMQWAEHAAEGKFRNIYTVEKIAGGYIHKWGNPGQKARFGELADLLSKSPDSITSASGNAAKEALNGGETGAEYYDNATLFQTCQAIVDNDKRVTLLLNKLATVTPSPGLITHIDTRKELASEADEKPSKSWIIFWVGGLILFVATILVFLKPRDRHAQ